MDNVGGVDEKIMIDSHFNKQKNVKKFITVYGKTIVE